MRYTSVLNLLQSKVLTNKYKLNSVKTLVDSFAFELTKNQNEMTALSKKLKKNLKSKIFF